MQNGFDHEMELAKLKLAYAKLKDTMIHSYLTESAFCDTVTSHVHPETEIIAVWSGLERMKKSGTPRNFLPPLHRFLRDRRYLESWAPREECSSLRERIQNL